MLPAREGQRVCVIRGPVEALLPLNHPASDRMHQGHRGTRADFEKR